MNDEGQDNSRRIQEEAYRETKDAGFRAKKRLERKEAAKKEKGQQWRDVATAAFCGTTAVAIILGAAANAETITRIVSDFFK